LIRATGDGFEPLPAITGWQAVRVESIFADLGWPYPSGSVHVYALPDPASAAALAAVGASLAGLPFCAEQPVENLHATVSRLPWFLAEADTPPVADIAAAVGAAVARIPPFTVELGAPEVATRGVLVAGDGDGGWDDLVAAVRTAAGALAPERPMPPAPYRPHVSVAYGVADGDDAPVRAALATAAAPAPYRLRVDEVHLLAVRADDVRGVFSWEALATLPLRQPTPTSVVQPSG
jgi:hypothetical protein